MTALSIGTRCMANRINITLKYDNEARALMQAIELYQETAEHSDDCDIQNPYNPTCLLCGIDSVEMQLIHMCLEPLID